MAGVRILANCHDLTMPRSHKGTKLVVRQLNLLLRLAVHSNEELLLGGRLDEETKIQVPMERSRHTKRERVKRPQLAKLRRRLVSDGLKGEAATHRLGRFTHSTSLTSKRLDVISGEQTGMRLDLSKREKQPPKRDMPTLNVSATQERHPTERWLAHAKGLGDTITECEQHRVDRTIVQQHERCAPRALHCAQYEHHLVPIGHGNTLQPAQLRRVPHEQRDGVVTLSVVNHSPILCVKCDRVSILIHLDTLRDHDGHGQILGQFELAHSHFPRAVGTEALVHEQPRAFRP